MGGGASRRYMAGMTPEDYWNKVDGLASSRGDLSVFQWSSHSIPTAFLITYIGGMAREQGDQRLKQ